VAPPTLWQWTTLNHSSCRPGNRPGQLCLMQVGIVRLETRVECTHSATAHSVCLQCTVRLSLDGPSWVLQSRPQVTCSWSCAGCWIGRRTHKGLLLCSLVQRGMLQVARSSCGQTPDSRACPWMNPSSWCQHPTQQGMLWTTFAWESYMLKRSAIADCPHVAH